MIKWIKKLFKKKPEKETVYCVNCEHCRPSTDIPYKLAIHSLEYANCVAPQNVKKDKEQTKIIKLIVNGRFSDEEIDESVGIEYDCELCLSARRYNCGKTGLWYSPKKEE